MHDRRFFLKVLAGSTAAVCAAHLAGCGGADSIPATASAGNVKDLPVGTLQVVSGAPLAIGRDSGGLYAMTLICTHNQCDIATDGSVTPTLITCRCHGSKFDADGNVVQGPADAPLQHFEVTVDASGEVTIHGDTDVDQETRVAVDSSAS